MTSKDTSNYIKWDATTSAKICKAYRNASEDSERGTDQTSAMFWEKVSIFFQNNCSEMGEVPVLKLKGQFSKVSTCVAKYASHYDTARRNDRSGSNGDRDYTIEAMALYAANHPVNAAEVFKFSLAYEELKQCPKWKRKHIPSEKKKYLEEKEREKQEAKARKVAEAMSSVLVIPDHRPVADPDARPIGKKAAKRQRGGESASTAALLEKLATYQEEALAKDQLLIDQLEAYNKLQEVANQQQEELLRLKRQKLELLRSAHAQNNDSDAQ